MKQEPCNRIAVFHLSLFFVVCLMTKTASAQATPIGVRVGVILDLDDYIGEMELNCISMALEDFYVENGHYKTRLVLHVRNSHNDVVEAAAAGIDLLKNVGVQAIIGPIHSMQASFLIALGHKAQVPIITFSATSTSLTSVRSSYFIRATLDDSLQVHAIGALIQAFGWREVVPIYEDNEFGQGIIPNLSDALEHVNARVPYRSVIPSPVTDNQILQELYKLMSMQTRVFVVHMRTTLGSRLFTKAKQLGMMSEDYTWIITDGMANELSSMDPSVIEFMLGVIGVQPYIPRTKELDNFTVRYKKRLQQNSPMSLGQDLNIFGLWAHDSAISLAMAAEKALLTDGISEKTNVSRNSTDVDAFGASDAGPKLVQALSRTTFTGLAGKFQLVDGQLQSPPYEIVNVVGRGVRVVGYWMKKYGIIRELEFTDSDTKTYSISKSNLGSIIWPGDKTYPSKGWVIPTSGKKLKVGVPVKSGFTEFVRITWNADNSTTVEGHCTDIFDAVMAALPYGVPYEYVPFATSDHQLAGSYNDLTYQVYLGNYDAVAGDVTILANRSQYVDFTLPYLASGVSMVVPIKDYKCKNAWVFVKPLTWELWLTSFCSFVFIGVLIWILEHRINEDFRGPPWHQVGMIFWFAFSTMVFAQKERVVSNLSRFVLIIWFLVVLILTQSYTASLTSMLTVQQMQPTVKDVNALLNNKDYVGYSKGSFVYGLLQKMNFDESRLVAFNSPEEMDQLLSKGSGNGGIAAAFHEIPYLKLFLSYYCSKYIMVDSTYKADGFGFVFPIGSPLVRDVSKAILDLTESRRMVDIDRKWFGDGTNCQDPGGLNSPKSLGLRSFWGLFLIVGMVGISAFTIYVMKFLHEHRHVIQQSDHDSTIWSKAAELLGLFNNRDLTCHTFKNKKPIDKENGCDGNYMGTSVYSSPQTHRHSPSSFSLTPPLTNCPPSPIFSRPRLHYNLHFQGDHENSMENENFSCPTEQNNILYTWQGNLMDNVTINPPTEVSQINKQEIELARQDENGQITSNSAQAIHRT